VWFDEPTVPAFPLKLYTMLEDPNTDDIIGWSQTGDSFVVYQPAEFSQLVLPQFFKHSNFQSFIRQLNLYEFRKLRQAAPTFDDMNSLSSNTMTMTTIVTTDTPMTVSLMISIVFVMEC
jgi:hypothetical protein